MDVRVSRCVQYTYKSPSSRTRRRTIVRVVFVRVRVYEFGLFRVHKRLTGPFRERISLVCRRRRKNNNVREKQVRCIYIYVYDIIRERRRDKSCFAATRREDLSAPSLSSRINIRRNDRCDFPCTTI